MPFLQRPCGARIYYELRGSGFPVLLLAPGGMRSSIGNWARQPYDPWAAAALPSRFSVIAMDQRHAGQSTGPLAKGWRTFAEDQLALLEHLRIERCLLLGSCIGPSYALQLMRLEPQRFNAAVLLQPIGLATHTTEPGEPWRGLNQEASSHWFGVWADEMAGHTSPTALAGLHAAMFGESELQPTMPCESRAESRAETQQGREFVFSVSREQSAALTHPMLVLMGRDLYHPSAISRELVAQAPKSRELIEAWRDRSDTLAAASRIMDFLDRHQDRHSKDARDDVGGART